MKLTSFQKIVVPIIMILILTGVSIIAVVSNLFTEKYESTVQDDTSEQAAFVARSVEEYLDKAYHVTEQAAFMDEIVSMNGNEQESVVKGLAERNEYFELVYVQDMNGDQTARSTGELGNRANRWWFKEMLELDKPFISKSYYSISTDMTCASVFFPIKQNGNTVGIFATDLKLASLQQLVDEFSDIEEGKISFIVDGEGNVVAHPDATYYQEMYNYVTLTRTVKKTDESGETCFDADGNILTEEKKVDISSEYKDLIDNVMKGESGDGIITDNDTKYFISYVPVTTDGESDTWSVITLRDYKKSMSLMHSILDASVIVIIVAVIIAIMLISVIVKTITGPMKKSLDKMKDLSNGKLVVDRENVRGTDEASELLRVTNKTVGDLDKIINDINTSMTALASGDVTCKGKKSYPGKFDTIGSSINKIEETLNRSFCEIDVHAREVSASASAISVAAQALSKDTINQASAVEELAASIKFTSANVSANADATKEASNKVGHMSGRVSDSNEAAKQLKIAMQGINENSKKINGISKLIQDISFQTNLLSMNASVEAVRAGNDGKGFSVIAAEIRELAAKCSEASDETVELLESTTKSIESGMEILDEAVITMESMVEESVEVNRLIDSIAVATEEQSESISQISKALEQISGVVQNNSAVSEETAATSIELQDNAARLQQLVGRYRY